VAQQKRPDALLVVLLRLLLLRLLLRRLLLRLRLAVAEAGRRRG
jgi:hypothetical protein